MRIIIHSHLSAFIVWSALVFVIGLAVLHKEALRLLKDRGITGPQCLILRNICARIANEGDKDREDGTSTRECLAFGEQQRTLDSLISAGFLGKAHRYSQSSRTLLADQVTTKVWTARTELSALDGDWKVAAFLLGQARQIDNKIHETCLKITNAGIRFVAEFESYLTPVGEEDRRA
jgi:hypothetical protein